MCSTTAYRSHTIEKDNCMFNVIGVLLTAQRHGEHCEHGSDITSDSSDSSNIPNGMSKWALCTFYNKANRKTS